MVKHKHRQNKLIGVLAEKRITQENLAKMLTDSGYPISRVQLNNKINGHSRIYYEDMLAISRVLDKAPEDIFFNK